MACDNLQVPKPLTNQCPTNLFGIPYGAAGRIVAGVNHPISAIVLHCYDGTIGELCNEMKCRTRSSVISGSYENSFHYGIGAAGSSGGFLQFTEDGNVSWSFGTYKNNTYATIPPPNIAINWPVLQGEFGINTTPDLYTIDIALAIGHITAATTLTGCYDCPTASGLQQTQHDMLVQMLAYLAQEYNIPIDQDHIQFHDLIHCGEGQECPCTDIETLLAEVAAFCPPCPEEAFAAPEAGPTDDIQYIYGATEPCCPESPGCLVKIPWNECYVGGMAVDGTLDSYILGLSQDPVTMQWCLTRGCLALESPLVGCGTVDDPLRIDNCLTDLTEEVDPTEFVSLVGLTSQNCMVNAPIDELMALYETPLTVVDTPSINLTASGTADHTLQADVNISTDAGNQIEIRADGLFADFTCVDVIDAYPPGDIVTLIGTDAVGDCVYQPSQEMVEGLICSLPETPGVAPEWFLVKTAGDCPVFVPDITVSDGFCVHMNYNPVTRNINSELIVAPHLLDNIFQCIPGAPGSSGAYVQDLSVTNGDCINLTYVGRNLTADIQVSAIGDNVLTCEGDGLYVPIGAGLSITDTDCLNLTLVGGLLSGVITFAPTQGLIPNVAQCLIGQGLYVPQGAGLTVSDTNCIDLTIANGNLTADIVINPSGDNQLACGVGGLYVPIAAGLIANDTDCVNHSLVGGVLSTTLNIAGPQGGIPNILSCLSGQGLYVPESHIIVQDTTCINLTFNNNILTADVIIDPTGDNQIQCLPAGLYVPPTAGLVALDTDCIALNLAGVNLTATPILAPTQAGCNNALLCLQDGLYVQELTFTPTDCIQLTKTGCDITATPILSGDDCNGLECRNNGLYVNNDIQAFVDRDDLTAQGIVVNFVAPGTLPPGLNEIDGQNYAILAITNPSDCNDMAVYRSVPSSAVTINNSCGVAAAVVQFDMQWSNVGPAGPWQPVALQTVTVQPGEVVSLSTQPIDAAFSVAPGQTRTVWIRTVFGNNDGNFCGSIFTGDKAVTIIGITALSVT